ncbi:hypothetical protein AB0C07_30180 [Actinoplanes missouriensis]|uniref:hypothetical protein n=1 Tax=Actinoplanes missouriensis TaxID=1866 RepID=UPI0034112141
MGTTKLGAALTGFAAFVVFTIAFAVTRGDLGAGLQAGAMIGIGVLVAHWFAATPRRHPVKQCGAPTPQP